MKIEIKTVVEVDLVTVPETTLPGGAVVPEFRVGKYITGRENGALSITAGAEPWTRIDLADSKAEAKKFGLNVITELQCLALAHNIAQQPINWTSGVVGEGKLFQGLHKGTVSEAQPGTYESPDPDERRWFELSNGERIWDVAGNLFTWVVDDVQGDENGIVSKKFAKDSPSITTAPAPSMQKGCGWQPSAGDNWSGDALVRGGCWDSDGIAGVFGLNYCHPGDEGDYIGFRCTYP
jgi:hypothetical protein